MPAEAARFFAPRAWVGGRWLLDALLEVDGEGRWSSIQADCPAPLRGGAKSLAGPVLPGLVNGHSHAFQRAIAGMTERSRDGQDDFWSWRDRMYAVALRVSPEELEAIAAFLYSELLRAGYTHVCEFHYVHNAPDGTAYADAGEMSRALVRAAARTGIGLTLLPTLYMRSGFGAAGLRGDQRRFASTPESVLRIAGSIPGSGIALHSLRAVDEGALKEIAQAAGDRMPLHIHIAEQRKEVADCLERHGKRPIEWLLDNVGLRPNWNLVHATQANRDELAGVRAAGASIVLCPSTEGNLGDGVFDLPAWLGASGRWSIGSDSHVTRSWQEELRLLEYSQRFVIRERNIAARSALNESSAAALFEGALEGGSAAAGQPLGGIAVGQRADFCVVDMASDALAGVPQDHLLDALVFSSPDARFEAVYVGGRRVEAVDTRTGFEEVMRRLW